MRNWVLCLGCATIVFKSAYGADLMDIYQQAIQNDTQFKQAYDQFKSISELVPQARALLMPQLGMGAQLSKNNLVVHGGGINFTTTYGSQAWELNASQALFNAKAWNQLKTAKSNVKAATANYFSASQNLILRVAQAYFDAQLAKDTLSFAESKKRANQRQLDQAQERFNVGLEAITSVYEAKAAYDQSVAQVIAAKNNLVNQNENIRKLTNHVYDFLAPLKNSEIPLVTPEPNVVEDWIDTGIKQNYSLMAARYSLDAARENIKTQFSGHLPTVNLQGVGNTTRNNVPESVKSLIPFFAPDYQRQAAVQLNVSLPIYQGGLVESNTKQAKYNFQQSSEQLEQTYRDIQVNTRIAFNRIIDGVSQVRADRQTVMSQTQSLQSTEAQFQAGTRTMVDVVNAQQKLFDAQRQLAADQYSLINAFLNLKFLAGTLNVNDLTQVNAWLETTQVEGTAPVRSSHLSS